MSGKTPGSARGISIHWLLLGANALVLVLPLLALGALRIYDSYLLRQTERQLIGQSVVLAEAWREAWLAELEAAGAPSAPSPVPVSSAGEPLLGHDPEDLVVPPFRPPYRSRQNLIPIGPVADLGYRLAPPQPRGRMRGVPPNTPERRAALRVQPLMRRSQVFNLSAVRILDTNGCVIATTRGEAGICLDHLPEVRRALGGRYASVARERISDEPPPPLSSIRRRGSVRLFTALPVFSDGRVVAVVRTSRTSLDALTSLWQHRRGLLLAGAASLLLMVLVSVLFAGAIARPVRAITRAAEAIARGETTQPLAPRAWMPGEIHTLSQALQTMTRQLSERAAYVERFASNVSHELKTPLTGVRGATELLREQWHQMSEQQRERFLGNIDADAARMERLVTRLLMLARIQNLPEAAVEVELRPFFEELLARHPEGQLRLHWQSPPASLRINPDHLASAVGNLVDNAVHHGGEAGPVELHVGGDAGRLKLEVVDRGPGISEANQKRLFERFFTTRRDQGGTGLGLAIVKAIADSRGGEVRCVSGPGGSRFTVVL